MSLAFLTHGKPLPCFHGAENWPDHGHSGQVNDRRTAYAQHSGPGSIAYWSGYANKAPVADLSAITADSNSRTPFSGAAVFPPTSVTVLQSMPSGELPKRSLGLSSKSSVLGGPGPHDPAWVMHRASPESSLFGGESNNTPIDASSAADVDRRLVSPPPSPFVNSPFHGSFGLKQHSLYKTELCRSWEETGACRYGSKCQFAHGIDELREIPRHPKYKTEICCTFATTGTCPYGRRCRFIHQNGPITLVGAKRNDDTFARTKSVLRENWVNRNQGPASVASSKTSVKSQGSGQWPARKLVCDPLVSASRRLPIFVQLSMADIAKASSEKETDM
ncbi:hypothetical protein BSKO_07116 [Bryopsis sp. KO-2023]|nr:hypothetical protein BSKO_07116 [Bryopsis sp. KO-2023]